MQLFTSPNNSRELKRDISLYRQRRNYTCGPSSVMMVMSALDPQFTPNEVSELEIWREATTIHGGCGPVGLALALDRRKFRSKIIVNHDDLFLGSRASRKEEIEAMRLLQARDMAEARDRSIEIAVQNYTLEDLTTWMTEGWHPIVMIGIEYEGINITHWIVITGIGSGGLLVNDPLKDVNMPDGPSLIDYQTFAEISSFGERRERAVVLAGIREPESRPTIR
ncbi:hypothetical protein GHK39_03850 [Sinorhizobium medicae]|uniref:peptidase C39 family protein n=1 Tax=Sinorhizobium medicae TaxID=110321 RepID=UPI001296CCBF|nr:peptidase C39 family protein [Sinorhizobium medicae]MDX0414778.1 hypothetical protein [Sinorhizobium medicae]MDX0469409.1 hypothetical protein [Sinorhizobium medicae]MDX0475732.1 hypothetical protein [Sinorhizobium medicae]MDX0900946.1 hypothetical protein [Sinorhizobium medicae]MDX1176557.1 hypothetical protein [Sinorhizobium medicae]